MVIYPHFYFVSLLSIVLNNFYFRLYLPTSFPVCDTIVPVLGVGAEPE